MRKFVVSLVLGLLVLTPTAARGPVEPVLVGGTPDLDACGTIGQVTGLNPKGDNFLAVREGPGTGYGKIDELHGGDEVIICDEFEGWYGIVYGDDCGLGTPIADRRPYNGPCASGWVSMRYVEIIAG